MNPFSCVRVLSNRSGFGWKSPPLFGILFSALAITAATHGMAAGQSLPPVPDNRIVDLTPAGFFDEPSIAINPRNPQQLVAAYQSPARVAYSEDGGAHWTTASGTAPSDYRVSGDVSVTYDARGHAILCYIAFDKLGTTNYWGHNATRNGIFIRRSPDGGKTWEQRAVPVFAHPSEPNIPFEDKPYVVADNSRGAYAGNLYVGWTHFTLSESVMYFSRSTDGGKTWSKPIQISAQPGLPRDDNGALEGFTGAVGTDSTLYVAWADGQGIVFTSSSDGGRSFASPRRVIRTAPPYFKVEDVDRANGFPVLGIDPRTNRLYLTWSDYRNGDVDVFCSTSDDQGKNWGPTVRINSDPIHNGADQFFPWLAVDPVTGTANLIFYDRRGDPENRKTILVLARSTDGGRSFTNYAWTTRPFDARDDFIGDYTGVAAYDNRVYGVWTEEVGKDGLKRLRPQAAGQAALEPRSNSKARHTAVQVGIADFGSAP